MILGYDNIRGQSLKITVNWCKYDNWLISSKPCIKMNCWFELFSSFYWRNEVVTCLWAESHVFFSTTLVDLFSLDIYNTLWIIYEFRGSKGKQTSSQITRPSSLLMCQIFCFFFSLSFYPHHPLFPSFISVHRLLLFTLVLQVWMSFLQQ